jgi:hypothetical protein
VRSEQAAIGRVVADDFDPGQELVSTRSTPPPVGPCTAAVTQRSGDRMVIDVDTTAPTVVVAGNRAATGWSATLDGRSVPIDTVDGFLQGMRVPAGHHTIELRFGDGAVRAAVLLDIGMLAVVVAGGLAWWVRGQRRPAPVTPRDAR